METGDFGVFKIDERWPRLPQPEFIISTVARDARVLRERIKRSVLVKG
jgi:hypothetical protein